MNIGTYVEKARSTAIYDGPVNYPAHGLAGEVGELVDKMTSMTFKNEVKQEAGDVLWYIVNTAIDASLSFHDICSALTGGLRVDNFTELVHQIKTREDTRSTLVKMPIYVGRVNEVAKKMIRDNGGVFQKDKKTLVFEALVELMACLVEVSRTFHLNLDDIAKANINKLLSRKARGVIQGSGDNR